MVCNFSLFFNFLVIFRFLVFWGLFIFGMFLMFFLFGFHFCLFYYFCVLFLFLVLSLIFGCLLFLVSFYFLLVFGCLLCTAPGMGTHCCPFPPPSFTLWMFAIHGHSWHGCPSLPLSSFLSLLQVVATASVTIPTVSVVGGSVEMLSNSWDHSG